MSRTTIHDIGRGIDVERLRCVGDYSLIRMVKKDRTSGGIFLAGEGIKSECAFGKVISKGRLISNGHSSIEIPFDDVRVGDYVLTMQYMGENMEIASGSYKFIREHGIWAVVQFEDEKSFDIKGIKPRFDCIVLEPDREEKVESGLLFLPDKGNANCGVRRATVVSVGPGKIHLGTGKRVACGVKAGDKVIFQRYAGAIITVDGNEYRICQEQDIHVIEEQSNG